MHSDAELSAYADVGVTWVLVAGWVDELDEVIELVRGAVTANGGLLRAR